MEVRARGRHQGADPGRAVEGADVFLWPLDRRRADPTDGQEHGAQPPSSSPWPIPIPRSPRRRSPRSVPTPSWPPAAPTMPTRSQRSGLSLYLPRRRSTCGPAPSNEEMKIAAAQALAKLAREDVPDEVAAAYHGSRLSFGRDYLIPVPFDPRLISTVPVAVAKAAMDSGVPGAISPISMLCGGTLGTARPHRAHHPGRLREGPHLAQAGGLRRGRGRSHDPGGQQLCRGRPRPGHSHRTRERDREYAGGERPRTARERRRAECPHLRAQCRTTPTNLYERLQRNGFLFRDCHAWPTRTATSSPPAWWRWAMPMRWSPA